MPHQGVRPLRNGRLGKARAAFGGCNDKLCNGGHRGDSWDSGLVRSEPDAADPELGVAVGLFYGGGVVGTLGPSDAERRQSPPPRARSRSGLVETRGNARETSSFNSRRCAVVLEALPRGAVRRLNNETHVHPRTPSVKSSVGEALQTRASAASVWSPAEAERTVKSARPAFGGCNVSYAELATADTCSPASWWSGICTGRR